MDEFVNLHTHTHCSAFDGLGTADEFASRVSRMGQCALAITDHGSLRGLYAAQKACDKAGLKFIPGVEAYLCDDAERKGLTAEEKEEIGRGRSKTEAAELFKAEEARRRDRDHITIWAMDDVGLRSLYRLTAWSWTAGFYYKPRVDLKRLKEFNEGLLVSTGCPTGIVSSPLRRGKGGEAVRRAAELADIFGDRLYVEIMPHVIDENQRINGQLLRIAEEFGAKVIATQDAHYPERKDAESQEVMLAIQTRARMSDPDRFCFGTRDYWARTRAEMAAAFGEKFPGLSSRAVDRALDETTLFAERCAAKIKFAAPGAYLAAPEIPPGYDGYDDWLAALCARGAKSRFPGGLPAVYRQRLFHELDVIATRGVASYFIAVWDAIQWAREQKILCAPRGSAAGCLVSYVIGISHLDPVVHDLSFERFLPPGRKDLPDIDVDFEQKHRQRLIEYLRQKYGEDRVAFISALGTFGAKSLVHDIARTFELPRDRAEMVAKSLGGGGAEEEAGDEEAEESPLAAALASSELGRGFLEEYRPQVALCARFQGQLRSVGVHAAGVVISSVPLRDIVPIETRGRGDARVQVVAYDMHGVEAVGLAKMDFLGVKTLDILHRASDDAGVDLDQIPLEDPVVLQAFNERRFNGVFQFDTPSARRLARGHKFEAFGSIADFTALDRPGPLHSGMADEYVYRQSHPEAVALVHPLYDEITRKTCGVLVYQEQIVALAERLAGYSPEAAQALRKKIGKKLGAEDEREAFVAGLERGGMTHEAADDLFGRIKKYAEYAFCRCLDTTTSVVVKGGGQAGGGSGPRG